MDEIIGILEEITGRKMDNLTPETSLFSSSAGLSARDVVYFVMELEDRRGKPFDVEQLNNQKFFTLGSIASTL